MGIRKREWTWEGKTKSAWVYEWRDLKGKKRLKTFRTKAAAADFEAQTRVDIKAGTHIADGDSITVSQAGELWLASCEEAGLERSSIARNRQHVERHINPLIGATKLPKLTVGAVRTFMDRLRSEGRSQALARMVLVSLGSILADAQERGLASSNPVRDLKRRRGKRGTKKDASRAPLAIGVDIPAPAEIRDMLAKASVRRRAIFATLAFSGLRGSELRGLRWSDIDLAAGTISVRQRADAWGDIGERGKSAAAYRTVPVPPLVLNALKEWKLACPLHDTGKKDASGEPIKALLYVFPNSAGNVEFHQHIVRREWHPLQLAAGISVPALDDDGKPVMALSDGKPVPVIAPKYSGLHALRHFFCSWCAARREDGGLGLPLKTVQVRMGHKTLAMTSDRYGHLWPSSDESEALAAAECFLMG